MRVYLKLAAYVCAILAVSFATSAGTSRAEISVGSCAVPYIVRRGDTLSQIARTFSTSVQELIQLNHDRVKNPNLIRIGQELCLPARPASARMTIETTYRYAPNNDESNWSLNTRGGLIGRRAVYPLVSTGATDTVSTTSEVAAAIDSTPAPVLLGIRNGTAGDTYTLVAVGDQRIITSLLISDVQSLETILPPIPPDVRAQLEQRLGGKLEQLLSAQDLQVLLDRCWPARPASILGTTQVTSPTIWLESDAGLRYPFFVTHVDFVPDTAKAKRCYAGKPVGFALFLADTRQAAQYRLRIVLTEQGIGPPGDGWRQRCDNWQRSGPWFQFLRSWYGCP